MTFEDDVNAYRRSTTDPDRLLATPACPRCNGPMERIRRRVIDRVASLVLPLRRYRCHHFACQWEGLVRRRRRAQPASA